MSTQQIQDQRKAQALDHAIKMIQEVKRDTDNLDETEAEPLIPVENRIVALVYEAVEMLTRQERALDHISDHVLAAQQTEIEALGRRVEELETSAEKRS